MYFIWFSQYSYSKSNWTLVPRLTIFYYQAYNLFLNKMFEFGCMIKKRTATKNMCPNQISILSGTKLENIFRILSVPSNSIFWILLNTLKHQSPDLEYLNAIVRIEIYLMLTESLTRGFLLTYIPEIWQQERSRTANKGRYRKINNSYSLSSYYVTYIFLVWPSTLLSLLSLQISETNDSE